MYFELDSEVGPRRAFLSIENRKIQSRYMATFPAVPNNLCSR